MSDYVVNGARAKVHCIGWVTNRQTRARKRLWQMDIYDSRGRLVNSDHTCGLAGVCDDAAVRVAAVRQVESMGHRLKPWSHLLEKAYCAQL